MTRIALVLVAATATAPLAEAQSLSFEPAGAPAQSGRPRHGHRQRRSGTAGADRRSLLVHPLPASGRPSPRPEPRRCLRRPAPGARLAHEWRRVRIRVRRGLCPDSRRWRERRQLRRRPRCRAVVRVVRSGRRQHRCRTGLPASGFAGHLQCGAFQPASRRLSPAVTRRWRAVGVPGILTEDPPRPVAEPQGAAAAAPLDRTHRTRPGRSLPPSPGARSARAASRAAGITSLRQCRGSPARGSSLR